MESDHAESKAPFSYGEIKKRLENLPIWVSTQATKLVEFEPEMVKDLET